MQWFLSSKLIFMSKISCSEKNPTTKSYHVFYILIVLHRNWMQMWQLNDSTANPMRSFLRKKTCFGYCFSETNILIFCTSFACCKVKKTLRRFQLEAPRAYKCKQILGLCHATSESITVLGCHHTIPTENVLLMAKNCCDAFSS